MLAKGGEEMNSTSFESSVAFHQPLRKFHVEAEPLLSLASGLVGDEKNDLIDFDGLARKENLVGD